MKISIVDPGGETGVVLLSYKEDLKLLWRGELGPEPHHLKLEETLYELGELDLLICERFEHRNDEFALLVSNEYIGVCKYFSQKYKVKLQMQGASQAIPWTTNEKLKGLGLLIEPVTKWPHANDALRHGVFYMCNDQNVPLVIRRKLLKKMFGKV